MGRGLLFQCQLPWRGRLSRQGPQTSPTYAVLAILSDSYPPLKGRLPTCYSPVRHFTRGRSPFLVRLACVRPAANVRSEPGSNSPVNFSVEAFRFNLTFEIVLLGESQLSGYSESSARRRSALLTFRTWFAIQLSETDAIS